MRIRFLTLSVALLIAGCGVGTAEVYVGITNDARVPTPEDELPEDPLTQPNDPDEDPPPKKPGTGTWTLVGVPQDDGVYTPTAWSSSFDMNALITDGQLLGDRWITAAQIQGYLKARNSFLSKYTDPAFKKTAAALIADNARAAGISPIYLLARIETESGGVHSTVANHLEKATGCGCPDYKPCSDKYKGFGKQIQCAALLIRGYYRELADKGETRAGWKVDVSKKTLDPCVVTPDNRATAVLYTYTPWVGAYARQCGTEQWGGSSLISRIYSRFVGDYTWGSAKAPAGMCLSGTMDRHVATGTCIQNAKDKLWRTCVDGPFTQGSVKRPSRCLATYPHCYSDVLKKSVPPRSCVQTKNKSWLQCGAGGKWVAGAKIASTCKGPEGKCFAMHDY